MHKLCPANSRARMANVTARHFKLTRRGRDDETGLEVEAVSGTQSLTTA